MMLLAVAFPVFPALIPPAFAAEEASEGQKQLGLTFIEKVAGIDLSAYTVDLHFHYFAQMPVTDWGFVVYLIRGAERVKVTFEVVNGKINYFACNGSPRSTRFGQDSVKIAQHALEDLKSHFNTSIGTQFTQILSRANSYQNQVITQGNLTLKVDKYGNRFLWYSSINGIHISYKALAMEISENGHLLQFINDWDLYHVGSTDIRISEQQAIDLALPYAQSCAAHFGLTIKRVKTTLRYELDRESLRGDKYAVYPMWIIEMPFDMSQSNQDTIYGYCVILWADTGTITYAMAQGHFTEPTEDQPTNLPVYFLAIAVALASTVTASFVAHKKRRNNRPIRTLVEEGLEPCFWSSR
jgi:hypothetical protein